MAQAYEVLEMLCPAGGWIINGNTYESITWVDERPRCTESQFEAGFAQYDAWKAQQDAQTIADKTTATANLDAHGLTPDDLKALGL